MLLGIPFSAKMGSHPILAEKPFDKKTNRFVKLDWL
jgi:hypothetical protein